MSIFVDAIRCLFHSYCQTPIFNRVKILRKIKSHVIHVIYNYQINYYDSQRIVNGFSLDQKKIGLGESIKCIQYCFLFEDKT